MPYYGCPGCGLTVHTAAAFSTARVCPHCSTALPEEARVYPNPTATRQIRRLLSARPEAPGKARHAVRALPVAAATRETLELLVSELVTNAVVHAGLGPEDPISLHITSRVDRVRLAVRDPGPGFSRPAAPHRDPLAPGGRGVAIVDALSDDWGVDLDASGCTVWCEVAADEQPGAEAAAAARPAGFEPATSASGGQRSIH